MPKGRENVPGVQEETEVDETETTEIDDTGEDTDESTQDDGPEHETVRETVERAARDLAEGKVSDGDQGIDEDETEAPEITPQKPIKGKGKQASKEEADFDPDDVPPARFEAVEKEMFNRLPKGLKKALTRTVKDLESVTTRRLTENAKDVAFSKQLLDHMKPFEADWKRRNLTPEQYFYGLGEAHLDLQDPNKREQKFREIAQISGLSHLLRDDDGESSASAPVMAEIKSIRDENRLLREELNQVQSGYKQQSQAQIQAAAAPILKEFEAVRDEVDPASGKYRFPKLHQPEYWDRVRPLVSAQMENVPELSYGTALKRAYALLENQDLPLANQIKPSAQIQKPSMPVSVRGKAASGNATESMREAKDIPMSVRDTVMMAYNDIKSGRIN